MHSSRLVGLKRRPHVAFIGAHVQDSRAEEGLTEDAVPHVLHRQIKVGLNVAHTRPWVVAKQANEVQGALRNLGILQVVRACLWQEFVELFFHTLIQSDAHCALEKRSYPLRPVSNNWPLLR